MEIGAEKNHTKTINSMRSHTVDLMTTLNSHLEAPRDREVLFITSLIKKVDESQNKII